MLLEIVRDHGSGRRHSQSRISVHEDSERVVVMSGVNSAEHERVAS
jgi:hypothetical protein